jgi:DNA-binding Lrp family transcriptional regulator
MDKMGNYISIEGVIWTQLRNREMRQIPSRGVVAMIELDDLDLKILRTLNMNARKSYRDIAKELDLSLTTVSKRIKRLEELKVILGYAPLLDQEKLGFDITAIIGVKILHGKILETERMLAKDPAVFAVYDSTGDWDAIVQARFRTRTDLNVFVKRVLEHEDVDKTYTQVVLNVTKDEKRILI